MKQFFKDIRIKTNGQKLIDFTNQVLEFVKESKINDGMINLSILHTSASLIIQENADHDVQKDLLNFFDKIVEDGTWHIIKILGRHDAAYKKKKSYE